MKPLILAIVGAHLPFGVIALASNLGPVIGWLFALACFFVAASYFIVRWFRVMGAVNASIALQASNRERFEP